MSVTIYLEFSFPVSDSNFYTVLKGDIACPNGHPKMDTKYCGECGRLLKGLNKTEATSGALELWEEVHQKALKMRKALLGDDAGVRFNLSGETSC